MKWITFHIYVDLDTGEHLYKIPEGYYKVKTIQKSTKIKHDAGRKLARATITITHGIRKAEYKQSKLY